LASVLVQVLVFLWGMVTDTALALVLGPALGAVLGTVLAFLLGSLWEI